MFQRNISEDAAADTASNLGREWSERAMPVVSGIEQAEIITWDEWKAKRGFKKGHLQIEWLYANNHEFKAAIDRNIMEIWERRRATQPDIYTPERFEDFFDLSRRYLLEEMAAFALMFESQEAIDIYPGTVLFAATLFKDREVEGAPPGLGKGHFCRVDFARNRHFEG